MGKIFISHSAQDKESIDFFNKVFSTSKVIAIYEEYEKVEGKQIDHVKIKADINSCSAVFVLLDKSIQNKKHTRDWIVWEIGVAKGNNKPVWVFEKAKDFQLLDIVTPHLDHFVVYTPTNMDWYKYIKPIVNSYDNSEKINTTLFTTATGAAISENKWTGGLIGLGIGLFITNQGNKKFGTKIKCGHCDSIYFIHIPKGQKFRCPICNKKFIRP